MPTIVVCLEGVLSDPTTSSGTILNSEALNGGKVLYDMLNNPQARIIILSSDPNADAVKAWLIRERMTKFAGVFSYDPGSGLSTDDWKVRKVRDLVGLGHKIAFYIDSNPSNVQAMLEFGVDAMLIGYSSSFLGEASGGFSEDDRSYKPWYSLVDTIEQQTMLKTARAAEIGDEDGE